MMSMTRLNVIVHQLVKLQNLAVISSLAKYQRVAKVQNLAKVQSLAKDQMLGRLSVMTSPSPTLNQNQCRKLKKSLSYVYF